MLKGALKNNAEWTQQEKELLKSIFDSSTYKQMSEILNRSESAVRHTANKLGLKKSNAAINPYMKYQYDRNFFSCIETEIQAYWLGFIAADGNVYKQKERKNHDGGLSSYLSIELSIKDIDHLKLFNKSIDGNIPVKTRIRNISFGERDAKESETCFIRLFSNQIVQDLILLEIVPDKTHVHKNLPIFSNEILNIAFLRGYYDGNGSFYIQQKTKDKSSGVFTISSPNKIYLESWRSRLYELYDISSYITEEKPNDNTTIPCYKLGFKGLVNTYKFGEMLYKDSIIYLPRKFNSYNRYLYENNIEERINRILNYKDKLKSLKLPL